MAMTRLRHDVDFLTTVALPVTVVATALTGVIADLWDLNDFWYHTVAGYAMGVFAVAHVLLNQDRPDRLWSFPMAVAAAAAAARPGPGPAPTLRARTGRGASPGRWAIARSLVSRRGLFGLTAGGVAGIVLGRGLRPAPPIEAGADVGVIYHQWSKPGIIDALGSLANWGQPVALYKRYPEADIVGLPRPDPEGGLRTTEAIARRRSTRDYVATPMTREELSRLLFLTSGIATDTYGNARRTAPSSGALYPDRGLRGRPSRRGHRTGRLSLRLPGAWARAGALG